ncbi:hypothetical protein ACFQL4_07465 [Halosimplex aquaticum]
MVIAAYSLVALAGLGAVYAVYAAGRDERLDGFELVEAGLAAAAFVFVGVYVVLGPTAPDVSAATVLLPGGYAIGLGALAVGYARVADLDLPVSPPTRDGWLLTGLAVAVVAVTAALVTAGATVVGWPDSPAAAFGYSPALDATSFVLTTVIPMTLSGVGAALLFNGAVQTALRRHRSPAAAAGAVTLLAFGADWSLAVVPVALTPVLGPVPAAFRGPRPSPRSSPQSWSCWRLRSRTDGSGTREPRGRPTAERRSSPPVPASSSPSPSRSLRRRSSGTASVPQRSTTPSPSASRRSPQNAPGRCGHRLSSTPLTASR